MEAIIFAKSIRNGEIARGYYRDSWAKRNDGTYRPTLMFWNHDALVFTNEGELQKHITDLHMNGYQTNVLYSHK